MNVSEIENEFKEFLNRKGNEVFEQIEKSNYISPNEFVMDSNRVLMALLSGYNFYIDNYSDSNKISNKDICINSKTFLPESEKSILEKKFFIYYREVSDGFEVEIQNLKEKIFPPESE